MILAGDIGGTKCNLALYPTDEGRFDAVFEATFPSREFQTLQEVAIRFLVHPAVQEHREKIHGACFGIAGPIVRGRVETPNLPWIAAAEELEKELSLKVSLINDLEALGYGVTTLQSEQTFVLNEGREVGNGHMALIAAGTGLGEALLIRQEERIRPVPSEGGHTDFAPRNDVEIELLNWLRRIWSHVSYERVVSGPGLLNIYKFLRDSGYVEETRWLGDLMAKAQDPSAVISEAAIKCECGLCVKALDMFVSLYGAETGNLALKVKATGGVHVGGGIAPKILTKLRDGTFMEAFYQKGRMESLLKSIPVRVILEPKTALYGAAYYGMQCFG